MHSSSKWPMTIDLGRVRRDEIANKCDTIERMFEGDGSADLASVSALRAAATALDTLDPSGLPPAALAGILVELRQLIDGLEGSWFRVLVALDRSGELDGGTAAWLRTACRLSPVAARSRVALSRRLAERPLVSAALSKGEISVDHARIVTTALDELAAVDRELAADTEDPLVEAATRLDPSRLRREVAHARHSLVPDATEHRNELVHRRRHLDVASTFDDTVALSGVLDAEGGEILLTALTALSGRSGPDDERSPGQRRADALVELCHRQLDRGELPSLGGERPHLTVLVPVSALAGAPAVPDRRDAASDGRSEPGNPGPTGRLVAAETMWGAVLGRRPARRLACDASITRVVIDPDSQPLDVGRRTRVIPPAIRTALVVRDRGCVHPGCDRGPQWTDAHHVRHWADGGTTSLDNLVLLCRQHHRAVHEGHSAIPHAPPRAA